MERLVPTWGLLRELPFESETAVSLGRVLRQRLATLEMEARALRYRALEPLLEDAVRFAPQGVGVSMGKILARQPDGDLLIIAGWNLHPGIVGNVKIKGDTSNPAGQSVIEHRVVMVPDLSRSPGYQLPSILGEHGVVSTTNVPIIGQSGIFGVLEIDAREARHYDELDQSFLIGIAGIIGEGVERVHREGELNRAVSAREALLREHHHRVRNTFQVVIAMLRKHAGQAPDARERFQDVERRLYALASVYDHLLGVAQSRTIVLQDYLAELCDGVREFFALDERGISIAYRRTEALSIDIDRATSLGIVVNELIANSVEHAFGDHGGEIVVCAERAPEGGVSVVVGDNGVGYTPAHEGTIGLNTARRLLAQIGASLDVSSEKGTTWKIYIQPEQVQSVEGGGRDAPAAT
jgi:two-component sensor histidine kinase